MKKNKKYKNYFETLSMESMIGHFAQLKPFFTSGCHKSIPKELLQIRLHLRFEVISIFIIQDYFNLFCFIDYQLCLTTFPPKEILTCTNMVDIISDFNQTRFPSRREFRNFN